MNEENRDPLSALLRAYVEKGDEDALAELIRKTRRRLLGAARKILGDEAEDCVQTAYLSLVRRAGEIDAPVLPWLLTATIRIAYRARAKRARLSAIADRLVADAAPGPVASSIRSEEAALLRREVLRLPARYRDPLVLHYLHELSPAETAALLGLPDSTLRTRLQRGRALLRHRLSPRLALPFLAAWWGLSDGASAAVARVLMTATAVTHAKAAAIALCALLLAGGAVALVWKEAAGKPASLSLERVSARLADHPAQRPTVSAPQASEAQPGHAASKTTARAAATASISGVLLEPDGKTPAWGAVQAVPLDRAGAEPRAEPPSAKVRGSGRFRIDGLFPGRYRLRVLPRSNQGGRPNPPVLVTAPSSGNRVVLSPLRRIHVHLREAVSGEPLRSDVWLVRVSPEGERFAAGASNLAPWTGLCSRNGSTAESVSKMTVAVDPFDKAIRVVASGYESLVLPLPPGKAEASLLAELRACGPNRIRLRFLDDRGHPVPHVILFRQSPLDPSLIDGRGLDPDPKGDIWIPRPTWVTTLWADPRRVCYPPSSLACARLVLDPADPLQDPRVVQFVRGGRLLLERVDPARRWELRVDDAGGRACPEFVDVGLRGCEATLAPGKYTVSCGTFRTRVTLAEGVTTRIQFPSK